MAKKTSVLAVDDSSLMLSMISSFLEGTKFEVVATVKNGKDALEKYKQCKPDIVLLDIVMPGESGSDTLSNILNYDSNACVIMVSSLGTEELVTECLKRGAKNFIQKPFEPEDLVRLLENVEKEELKK